MNLEKNKVVAEFQDNNMVIIKHITSRGTTEKYITFDDYAKAITSSVKIQADARIAFESPIMPNFYVRTIFHREYTTGAHHIILVREPEPADFILHTSNSSNTKQQVLTFNKVGMPRLLFAIKIFEGMIQSVKVCAVKANNITEETPLFNYPFSNVDCVSSYGGGSICFGSNKISTMKVKNLTSLHSVPNMFLSMPNNHDKYGHNLTDCRYQDLLELLEGQPFDNDILEPTNVKLKDWIEKLS